LALAYGTMSFPSRLNLPSLIFLHSSLPCSRQFKPERDFGLIDLQSDTGAVVQAANIFCILNLQLCGPPLVAVALERGLRDSTAGCPRNVSGSLMTGIGMVLCNYLAEGEK
jgi:hypothetical protein